MSKTRKNSANPLQNLKRNGDSWLRLRWIPLTPPCPHTFHNPFLGIMFKILIPAKSVSNVEKRKLYKA